MKILLADDHTLLRAGLHHVLHQLAADVVILEASTFTEARKIIAAHPDLDLAIFDLYMPDGEGPTTLATITQRYATLPVVVLSASEKHDDMQRVFAAGALGFIPKTTTPAIVLIALRLVLAGGLYVPPEMIDTDEKKASSPKPELTPRQLEVLARVIRGKRNKDIAREFGVSEATIKAHISAIFRILNVTNRIEAARAAEVLNLYL
jgi:DNA-binding NarL/FixJ family response regulator